MQDVSLKNTIYITDLLLKLMARLCDETIRNRFLALYDLTRKMRACMDALIPLEKYDLLCVPTNLLYRCLITDLMTSLLISQIDDDTFSKVMQIMEIDYTKSLVKSMDAEVLVKTSLSPDEKNTFEKYRLDYQSRHYDEFAECLSSQKGEAWVVKSKESILINGIKFKGTIDQIYKVLLTFDEVKDIAYIYKFYKVFSQSEHFSLKNRVFIYKQDFHDTYYNQTRGLLYFGEELIYKKYLNFHNAPIS